MTDREMILLTLLDRAGQVWGKTRIQKLLFLTEAEVVQFPPGPFQYYLYKHGPFSLDVAVTLDRLRDQEWIAESLQRTASGNPVYLYSITDPGREALTAGKAPSLKAWEAALEKITSQYARLDLPHLVEEAYAQARKRPELLAASPPTFFGGPVGDRTEPR